MVDLRNGEAMRHNGGTVTLIIPREEIASRWNGALEARLRHAPLEAFLRSRQQKWVLSGDARITDNLSGTTLYFMRGPVGAVTEGGTSPLDMGQQSAVGEMACALSHALACLIREPATWRIAGLVSTARLLSKPVGLDAAARVAATAARDFNKRLKSAHIDAGLAALTALVTGAVESQDEALFQQAVGGIEQRLAPAPALQRSGTAQS